MKDLFTTPELIPVPVKTVLEKYSDFWLDGFDYETLGQMNTELGMIGYTFDFYLDAEPYGLRPIGVPIESLEGFED